MKTEETYVERLTRILMLHNVIKENEAKAMAKAFKDYSGGSFDYFLLDTGLVSRTDLLNALSIYYNVPAFDVLGYFFNRQMLHMFPKGFLLRNGIIPLEHDDNIMIMIASDPQKSELISRIGEYVSYDIAFNVGLEHDISDAVKEFYDRSPAYTPDPNEPEETPEKDKLEEEANKYKSYKE